MDNDVANLAEKITQHLKRNRIFFPETPWLLKESHVGGRGLFASRDISPGEIILIDQALVSGPRAGENRDPICVCCCSKSKPLHACERKCGLPVCSKKCEETPLHSKECAQILQWKKFAKDVPSDEDPQAEEWSQDLLRVLVPIRALFIRDAEKDLLRYLAANKGENHGFEVDLLKNKFRFPLEATDEEYMRHVCSVFDTNGFECVVNCGESNSSVRGLYPLASLLNHNCVPNTMHVFDPKQRMCVQATMHIPKGQEIFASYTSFLWATPTRRHHLMKTKEFWCHCERCSDRLEFGVMLCALSCVGCDGVILPVDSLSGGGKWRCENCKKFVGQKTAGTVQSMLGSLVGSLVASDVPELLKFLRKRLPRIAPSFNQIVVELKCQAVWLLGHKNGFLWNELTDTDLHYKETLCRELLKMLEDLRAGQCKARGLFLYELHECLLEAARRHQGNGRKNTLEEEADKCLEEAGDILKYDISAPEKIRKFCQQKYGAVGDLFQVLKIE